MLLIKVFGFNTYKPPQLLARFSTEKQNEGILKGERKAEERID